MKIKVKIGDGYYLADVSAMTALRYRAKFNKSVINENMTDGDLLDLLYIAVGDDKIPYEKFLSLNLNRKHAADIFISARAVLSELLKESGVRREVIKSADEKIKEEDGGTIYDEFCIVAAMTNIGLSPDLLSEVSLVQLIYIIALAYEMKYGKKKEAEYMNDDEMMDALNITDEKRQQIEEYYLLHPEEDPAED